MATITGFTAARMQAIEDGTITTGLYDSSGHLILTKHDGTQIDVGRTTAATTAQSGIVELATNAETQAGTDATRAVTPAGLASIPGNKVQIISPPTESATPSSYPTGLSEMVLTGSETWSVNSSVGSVLTNNPDTDRCQQTFYSNPGGVGNPRAWVRYYHSTNNGGGWTAWRQVMIMNDLDPTSYTQSSAFTTYPSGQSRIYFTTSSSAGWDFSGKAGEVNTYTDGTSFARQMWTKHQGGTSSQTEIWVRTANVASGWSSWRIVCRDAKLQDPQLINFNGLNTITATSWADLPTGPTSTVTLSLPYDTIVQVELGSWLSVTYVDSTTVRAGVTVDGVNPENVGATGTWGAVLYEPTVGTTSGGGQHYTTMTMKLTAGSHTFKIQAYKTGTGTAQVNYPVLRVTPIRWAE